MHCSLIGKRTRTRPATTPLTLASLVIANASTVIGFGLLSFSQVPVLVALGTTVAPGTFLALLFAAIGFRAVRTAMHSIFCAASADARAPTRMVWLPGAYHSAQDFLGQALPDAAQHGGGSASI